MADNINVTQGAGTSVATDDVSGVHFQKVKIDLGGNGASAPLVLGQASSSASIPIVLCNQQENLLTEIEATVDDIDVSMTSLIAKDFATQTTLAAILAKIIAAPATETTLASVLAKIIAAPATEAKQDTLIGHVDGLETLIGTTNTTLTTIDGRVDGLESAFTTLNAKDFATQTTLAAVLAKIIAAPATEAKQDTLIGHVDGIEGAFTTLNAKDFATQTTLAAVLAKIIAAPSTEAKQDTIITALGTIDGRVDGLETAVAATNTKLDTLHADLDRTDYETVAAAQTDQTMGATGATGDLLERVIIIPANTSPGAVSIKDGAGSAITIFAGGASSVTTLAPIFVTLGMKSAAGAWKITTGADVSAIGIGKFTA